jgi:hypothetical protein
MKQDGRIALSDGRVSLDGDAALLEAVAPAA